MRKCLGFTLAIILVFSAFVSFIPLKSVEANGSGNYPPPVSGNWLVNVDTYVGNETIFLNGNLTIQSGASLTFRNVTLKMNCSSDGQYYIEVLTGASMRILDIDGDNLTTNDASWITSNNSNYGFNFWVRDGASFEMRNSNLTDCGYFWFGVPDKEGLYIETDNAIIDHSLLSYNYKAIILYGSDAVVSNNTISWNNHTGVCSMIWSNATIENNLIIANEVYGIEVDGGSNSDPKPSNSLITNNTILDTGRGTTTANGIHIRVFSNPTIMNNKILRSTEDGIYAGQECRALIINNSIDNGNIGNYGIATSDMGYLKVVNTSISNTVLWDISVADGEVNVINTSFNQSKVIFQNVAPQTVLTTEWYLHTNVIDGFGNPISDANIRIMDNSNGTYDMNFTTDANGFLNRTVLREYFQKDNNGDKDGDDIGERIDYSPYNVSVENDGYFSNYALVQMNQSKYITITLQADEKPEINHAPVPSANIGETINITANITDDVGVDAVYLDYTGVNATNYNVSMTQWNGNWSYYIPGQDDIGFVSYFIWCNDTSGNINMTGINQTQINDVTKPEINHFPVVSKNIDEIINITANVTDDAEVSNVTLYYENVGETTYTDLDMNLASGNNQSGDWSASIPTQSETGLAHYFIWANDTSGNNITSPIIGEYAIQITGPPSIEVTNPVGGEAWTGGNNHQIEFIASDTEDAPAVLDVFLNYTSVSVGNGTIAQIKGDGSPYDWTLPIIDATDVKINATVVDSDGNKSYDDSLAFTIDSSPPEVISTNLVNNTTGISIFQPIVIQFNEKMNIFSVIVNQTNGTDPGGWQWFWNEDKDTITGIHDAWSRGENVEITVQENYSDDSNPGNANNTAFIFSFTTETNPSPEIIHINISGPQELGDAIRINATFTDDGTVMNAVLWWQDVDENWHENYMDINGDDWEYVIPGQMIEGKIKYQINATDDLQQKNTTMIYEFDIEDTTPPIIVHAPVESAVVGEPINITCKVTDLGGVDVVYLYYKNETDTDFIQAEMNVGYWFELPTQSMLATIEYYIQALDIYGNEATTQLYSLEIIDPTVPETIPPEVLLATPTGDNIPISTNISIVFSEAMNRTSVEDAISVLPEIPFNTLWTNNQTLTLSITGNLSYNTTYTVTIDSGAKDLAGNILANDYTWQFSTVGESEIVQQPASKDYTWIGIIIFLVTIIMLMLFYQFNKERKKPE